MLLEKLVREVEWRYAAEGTAVDLVDSGNCLCRRLPGTSHGVAENQECRLFSLPVALVTYWRRHSLIM